MSNCGPGDPRRVRERGSPYPKVTLSDEESVTLDAAAYTKYRAARRP